MLGFICNNHVHTQKYAARVLLIHAGGYSQRLPSVSVVGKIFMGIPCGMLCEESISINIFCSFFNF